MPDGRTYTHVPGQQLIITSAAAAHTIALRRRSRDIEFSYRLRIFHRPGGSSARHPELPRTSPPPGRSSALRSHPHPTPTSHAFTGPQRSCIDVECRTLAFTSRHLMTPRAASIYRYGRRRPDDELNSDVHGVIRPVGAVRGWCNIAG